MPSFIEIIKRLLPGDYSTMTGHPDAYDRMREFVREVTERVPELRGKEVWEIEKTVQDAIEWAIKSLCKPIRTAEVAKTDYYEFIGVYSCYHPDIGRFYITMNEEEHADSGYGYWGVHLTYDKEKALEDYRQIVEEWKEKGVEYEEW